MNNILVTGSNGQLGSELKVLSTNHKEYNFFFETRDTLDITNEKDIEKFIKTNNINIIINTAAYTAVDKAEDDEKNALDINYKAVRNLASLAKTSNVKLIHISTDYVFDGSNFKPYKEDDKTNPQGVYGQTKLEGEIAIKQINPKNSIIIRTSWVYSSFGSNFVKTMLRLGKERDELGVIFDQVGTPTYARDLAQSILDIVPKLENNVVEIYHYSNEGVCSWYDFAKSIFELSSIECKVNAIETKDYPTPAQRPHYSVLNKSKIKNDFRLLTPYWRDSLIKCLDILQKDN